MLDNINTINTISNNKNDEKHLLLKVFSIVSDALESSTEHCSPTQTGKLYTAVEFLVFTMYTTFSMVSLDRKFCKDIENV